MLILFIMNITGERIDVLLSESSSLIRIYYCYLSLLRGHSAMGRVVTDCSTPIRLFVHLLREKDTESPELTSQ